MPSIITHDSFGREVYSECASAIGQSKDEKDAFLLGCQGPDVMFYGVINPLIVQANGYAKKLHRSNCTQFIASLCFCPKLFSKDERVDSENQNADMGVSESLASKNSNCTATVQEVAKAYTLGYLMHHELDSSMHPFVFSQEYTYCTAGVVGLDLSDASEVHVEIEREFDELVLTIKRGETISSFDPSSRILRANNFVLDAISSCYDISIPLAYNQAPPSNMYKLSVKATRAVQRAIYSTGGVKRNIFGSVESLFRHYSYLRAITHKNRRIESSIFENSENNEWTHPWIKGKTSRKSFWQIYERAVESGKKHTLELSELIDTISSDDRALSLDDAVKKVQKITGNLNFYGCPEDIANSETGKPMPIPILTKSKF